MTSTLTPNPTDTSRLHGAAPWLAGTWAGAFLGLSLAHLVRDTAPPWVSMPASVLSPLSSTSVSWLLTALSLLVLGGLAAVRQADPGVRRAGGAVLVGSGLVVALVVADTRALAFAGYLPMILLGQLGVGPIPSVDGEALWPSLAAVAESVGGLAAVVTGLLALRLVGPGSRPRWSTEQAAVVCRRAVAVAVVVPLAYAVTRLAWAIGVPLGVTEGFLDDLGDAKFAGLGLALGAIVGCLLTVGLVMRWGEVFWSWLPVVGGRPVPVAMAVVPALFVATIVTSAGLGFVTTVLAGHLEDVPGAEADWAAWAPELLWPLWGVALAVAAVAYRVRRSSPTEQREQEPAR